MMASLNNVIDLQNKTQPEEGKIEKYWFENKKTGLEKLPFYRIYIPLKKFDSELDYVEQPENTEIVIEWIRADKLDYNYLDGVRITSSEYKEIECSIYLGAAHNSCEIIRLDFAKVRDDAYLINCKLLIDFELTGVGIKEYYEFKTVNKIMEYGIR